MGFGVSFKPLTRTEKQVKGHPVGPEFGGPLAFEGMIETNSGNKCSLWLLKKQKIADVRWNSRE